jgi:membrane-associated protein
MIGNAWLLGVDWLDPEYLLDAMGAFAFWGMLLIIFAECGLFAILPGDSLLFVAGLFVANGWAYAPSIWVTVLAICVAAWLGNVVGYAIGYKVGPALFGNPDARVFKPEYAEKAHLFFEKYGPRAVILARFVPIVRTFITLMAGVGRMRLRTYLLYSAIGAVLWGAGITLAGYWLGQFGVIKDNIDLICVLIVLVSLIPMVVEYGRDRIAKRSGPAYAEPGQRYVEPPAQERVIHEDVGREEA